MNLWVQTLVPWVPHNKKTVAFWILIPHPSTSRLFSDRSTWSTRSRGSIKLGRMAWTLPPQKPTKITNKKKHEHWFNLPNAVTSYPITHYCLRHGSSHELPNKLCKSNLNDPNSRKKSAASPFASSTTIVPKNIAEVDPCVLI